MEQMNMLGSGNPAHPANELTPRQAWTLLGRAEIHLVDVRERAEWSQQRIHGAIGAPLSELDQLAAKLPTDKPIVFHCLSGTRSARAIELCRRLGMPHDTHMQGGLVAWGASGLPVQRQVFDNRPKG
jgi:rhodanese-related sulfurtransferase